LDILVVNKGGASPAPQNGHHPSPATGMERYIFLHIPKTGGQTFHNIIDREYRGQYAFDTQIGVLTADKVLAMEQSLHDLTLQELSQYRLLKGHMRFGLHEGLPLKYRYLTLMRHPIERAISHYYYIKSIPHHPFNAVIQKENLSLESFLQWRSPMVSNGQTRLIAGVDLDLPEEECNRQTLERAKRNIENHFVLVGLTDRFDEALLLMQRLIGWRTHYYVRKNVTVQRVRRKDLSPSALRHAEAANELDGELYEFARERFEATVQQMGSSFTRDLDRFRGINRWHGRIHYWRRDFKRAVGLRK
jgi:hypothetical protein